MESSPLCGCSSWKRDSRVVTGSDDPNPLVAGKGTDAEEHGVCITEHVLREECDRLNQVFFHYIQTREPFVVMKYAMTLDGKIAAYTGASKWITEKKQGRHVMTQRHRYSGIMAGWVPCWRTIRC